MNHPSRGRSLSVAILSIAVLSSLSCGGGGGGGRAGIAGLVIGINVTGNPQPIFSPKFAPPGVCPPGNFLNSRIMITFDGVVDFASLPLDGPAAGGGIQIVEVLQGAAAVGRFTVDPLDPATVVFTPFAPASAVQPCAAGLAAGSVYVVTVHDAAGNASPITVEGVAVSQAVSACFRVVECGAPGDTPFTDVMPGPPNVVSTTPPSDPTAPLTTQNAIADPVDPSRSTVVIDLDDALDPATVDANRVFLVNTSANAATPILVGADIAFEQSGTIPGTEVSRLTLTTHEPLADGDVHEIRISGLTDLAGTALVLAEGALRFSVQDNNDDQPVAFAETFDDQTNLGSLQGSIAWPGDGQVRAVFPIEIVGNGLDGPGVLDQPITINTDMVLTPGDPNAVPGVFNFTSLIVGDIGNPVFSISFSSTTDQPPGESNFVVNLRSVGPVTVLAGAEINGDGRVGEQGGNLPLAATSSRSGGWGGPGGGAGGVSSPNVNNAASPFGLRGEGGHVDVNDPMRSGGTTNNDPASPFFGGGGGAEAGVEASFAFGAGGGGGGSASAFAGYGAADPINFSFETSSAGMPHQGVDGMGAKAPLAGPAGPFPAAMLPPLIEAIGGSGGGAGGDRVIAPGTLNGQAPGAGGGGGGGGIRISSGALVSLEDLTRISCRGGDGGQSAGFFAGDGAGGSGGTIFIQSFEQLAFGVGVSLDCGGGLGGVVVMGLQTLGTGGRGGDGLIQLEDAGATFVADFSTNGVAVGEIFTQSSLISSGVAGLATSIIMDSGSTSVDYDAATALVDPGPVPGSMVAVQVTGFLDDPSSPGQPATVASGAQGLPLMMGPVDLNDIGMLDGFRYFRYEVVTSFAAPPMTNITDILPLAESFNLEYTR